MRAKIKATGEIVEVIKLPLGGFQRRLHGRMQIQIFKESDLDFLPEKETAVLEGWVCRDFDDWLWLSVDDEMPKRESFRWIGVIIENPATKPHYLLFSQNFIKPTFIDHNRMLRGDYFVKPTAYWFINCKPTHRFSRQYDKERKLVWNCKRGKGDGLCSEERSMIFPDYARNFICDFILGKEQTTTQKSLFDI